MRRDRATCIHEAGHVVMAEALGIPVLWARVFNDPARHGGIRGQVVVDSEHFRRSDKKWAMAQVAAGGPVAAALDVGLPVDWRSPYHPTDAKRIASSWGVSDHLARQALTVASRNARQILEERWERVLQVAEWLDERRAAEKERERLAEARRHARRDLRLTWAVAVPLIAVFSLGLVVAVAWLFGGFAETAFVGLLTLALWVAGSLAIYRGMESWVEGLDGEPPWDRPPGDIRQGQAVEDCMHVALGLLPATSRGLPLEQVVGDGGIGHPAAEPRPLRDAIRARARQTGRTERAVRENLRWVACDWRVAGMLAGLQSTLRAAETRWEAALEAVKGSETSRPPSSGSSRSDSPGAVDSSRRSSTASEDWSKTMWRA